MTFSVLSEADVLARYKKTPVKDRRQIVTVLADLTASRRCDMVNWLKVKGVWTDEVFCGSGCYERGNK